MRHWLTAFATVGPLLMAMALAPPSAAQQHGGTLKIGHFTSPASMSMLEESTVAVNRPMMGVFNNLVMFKQDEPQNTPDSIIPELATSWSWNEDGTELTFPLHQGVKWHDGKPFTAADVKCTIDLLQGKGNGEAAHQPAQGVVRQCRGGDDQRRLRGHVSPEAAAAVAVVDAGDRDGRRSIRATCRRRRCGSIRSAPGRSSLSNSSRTSRSRWSATRITGNRGNLISTASNTASFPMSRPGCCRSWRATKTSISV